MTERVVDHLEVVQIEKQQPHPGMRPPRLRQRMLKAVAQQHAVRQAGQRVVVRQVFDARLGLHTFGDIAVDTLEADQFAELVE